MLSKSGYSHTWVLKQSLFLICLFGSQVLADSKIDSGERYEPASFYDSERSFDRTIDFPASIKASGEDGTIVLRCDAEVNRKGKFKKNYCFNAHGDLWLYSKAIERSVKFGRVKPAIINGKARNITFQYFVAFSKSGDKTLVEAFANSGLQLDRYGPDYTSAQRYQRNHDKWRSGCSLADTVTVEAMIDKQGVISQVRALSDTAGEKCKNGLVRAFSKGKFIPAFYNNEPIDSFYSEDFVSPRIKRGLGPS